VKRIGIDCHTASQNNSKQSDSRPNRAPRVAKEVLVPQLTPPMVALLTRLMMDPTW